MPDSLQTKERGRPPPEHQKRLVQLINELGYRHSHWQVFADFVEIGAISISNAVDLGPREQREQRYMEVVRRYKPDEVAKFPEMFAEVTMALEEETDDVLGQTFHDLELHNKWSGQHFTPLCRMSAKMIVGDKAELEARVLSAKLRSGYRRVRRTVRSLRISRAVSPYRRRRRSRDCGRLCVCGPTGR
jgi:hypothetical protein